MSARLSFDEWKEAYPGPYSDCLIQADLKGYIKRFEWVYLNDKYEDAYTPKTLITVQSSRVHEIKTHIVRRLSITSFKKKWYARYSPKIV